MNSKLKELKGFVKKYGIMLTLRYIAERDEWFGIVHFTKDAAAKDQFIEPVDAYRESLDEVIDSLLSKVRKRFSEHKTDKLD